jgi:hypothetical protein
MSRASVAAVLRAVGKDGEAAPVGDMTPADVHVNTPSWPKPSKRRRIARTIRRMLGKAADPGLYVCRPLTEACEARLIAWLDEQSHGALRLDPNPHVTIIHSAVSVPWTPDAATLRVPRSQFLGFKTLGQDSAQVLRFRCPSLQRRWSAARSEGAQSSYPAFLPHLTLFYGLPSLRDWPLPPFELEFGPEMAGPLDGDVFKSMLGETLAEAVHESWRSHQTNVDDEHHIPYADLDEKAKQVDRDAVNAVLTSLRQRGYSVAPILEALEKLGAVAFDPAKHPKGAGGKYVSTGGPKKPPVTLHEAHLHVVHEEPKPLAPIMFTGKEGNIGKFQQGLVDKLSAAKDGKGVADVVLPKSASKVVKDYQKQLLGYHGAKDLPIAYAEPPAKPYKLKPVSPNPATNKLAAAVEDKAPHPRPAMASAPPVNTSYPEDQQKLYSAKIAQLQQAYNSSNPGAALASIPTGSPVVTSYKQTLQGQIATWEASKPVLPASVGDTVSSLRVVTSDTAQQPWVSFPQRSHEQFSQSAYTYRASRSHEEKQALNTYQGSGYSHMNSSIRADPLHTSAQHDALDRMLYNSTIDRDTRVIRNFNAPTLVTKAKGLVGRVIEDPAYMSTSLKGNYGAGRTVSIELNVPKGTKGLYLNSDSDSTAVYEHEVLLPRRTRWRIDEVVERKPGHITIRATVLAPHHQPSIPHGKKY